MSVTDMVMQYNYSEGSDSNSDFSKNVDKDPILFAIDSKADMIETSLTEEYASSERHSLKRRNETSDFSTSNKIRAMSEGQSSLYSSSSSSRNITSGTGSETAERKHDYTNTGMTKSSSGKKKKNEMTLEWLDENYVLCDGVCLARCILYSHYRDFCEKNALEPSCAATFGKTIRQKFPKVTTRRLGTRGHSKYHYYGIGIRETSVYYNSVYAGKGLTRYSAKPKSEEEPFFSKLSSNKEKVSTFLEEVPNIKQFNWAPGNEIVVDNMQIFLNLYKRFCTKILDAAHVMDFESLTTSLLRLWSDFPFEQYAQFIHNSIVMDLVSYCDVLLYEALLDAVLPVPCDEIDERHLLEIGNAVKQWDEYLKTSLPNPTSPLVGRKRTLGQHFAQIMLRHVSFIKLYHAVRAIFSNLSTFLPMRNDLEKISLQNSIGSQSLYASGNEENKDSGINTEILKELKDLLKKNPSVEILVEWLDSVVDAKVIKPSKQNGRSMKKRAQEFMLKWSFFGARITHNLNNTSATSFNSFQYLRMFLVEYVMLAIETQFNGEKHQEIRRTVAKHLKNQKPSQHTTGGGGGRQNIWPMKYPPYSHPGSRNVTEDKNNFNGHLKRWESYGCWHTNPGYDTRPIPDFAMQSHFYAQYDAQSTAFHRTLPAQSYSGITYAPLSSQLDEQNGFYHKREALVNDSGSYATAPAKPEVYPTIAYAENSNYLSGLDYTHAVGNPAKENTSKFESKYSIEAPNYVAQNEHYLKVPNSHLSRSPNISPYSTKMELSPSASVTSPMSSRSPIIFPQKQKDENFKESVYLIQDLSNSYQCQSNFKDFGGNSAQKAEHKFQQIGCRVSDELCSSASSTGNDYSPSFIYNDISCFDSVSDSSQHCFQTHDDNAPMWSGYSPITYLETASPYLPKSSLQGVFQENLPSISSVLSTD